MADEKDTKKAEAGRIGAQARNEALSDVRKREIGREAALARWHSDIPRAVNEGPLQIGTTVIDCAVLDGGTRLINQESFLAAIGRARKAKGGTGSTSMASVDSLPPFLAAENLNPFIDEDLRQSTAPILYRTLSGGRAFGYNALLLPKVCEVYLRLRDAKKDLPSQQKVVEAAYTLMRGLAQVGIIALVDRATGYEERAAKDELLKILQNYVAPELLPWVPRFGEDFFREIYRLHKWQ